MFRLRATRTREVDLQGGQKITYSVRLESNNRVRLNEENIFHLKEQLKILAKHVKRENDISQYTLCTLYIGFR